MDIEVDSQKLVAARYKIHELITLVSEGKVRIPKFQRSLRWTRTDVERLFDSIYRGFPIGTLLFWVRDAEAENVTLGPVEVAAERVTDALWVVDGQQRVTSLAASLLPSATWRTDPRFELSFDLQRETFGPARSTDPDTRIPVREAYDLQRVLRWLVERDLPEDLRERAFKLAGRLHDYEVPAYQVSATNEKALQVIFDRTNTFGKSMTKAEVFRALNTSSDEPKADIANLAEEIGALGFGELEGNTLLYAVLACRGPDVTREFRSEFTSVDDQIGALTDAKNAITRTIDFLRNRADVPHFSLIPYQHQTIGLVRFFALHPEPESHTMVLLRRWFWQAAEVGSISRLGNTGTLRATASAVAEGPAFDSVKRLLELSDGPGTKFDVGNYRWTSASTRVTVCALSQLRPVDLVTRLPIDVTRRIDLVGRDSLFPIISIKGSNDLRRTSANRAFLSEIESLSDSEVVDLINSASEDELASQHLRQADVELLRSGTDDRFLESRAQAIDSLVARFVDSRTERNTMIRPALSELIHE